MDMFRLLRCQSGKQSNDIMCALMQAPLQAAEAERHVRRSNILRLRKQLSEFNMLLCILRSAVPALVSADSMSSIPVMVPTRNSTSYGFNSKGEGWIYLFAG